SAEPEALDVSLCAIRSARVLHLCQTDQRQEANVHPPDVELVPLCLELRGMRIRVMIVVQLLSAEPDRNRRDVSALVLHLEIPIAKRVTDAVDDSCSPERNPRHLRAPHDRTNEEAEQVEIGGQDNADPHPVERREKRSLDPIVGCALTVLLEHSRLTDGAAIVECA